jgi:hypothetical protein
MKCGWGRGAERNGRQVRAHFPACLERPGAADHVERRRGTLKRLTVRHPRPRHGCLWRERRHVSSGPESAFRSAPPRNADAGKARLRMNTTHNCQSRRKRNHRCQQEKENTRCFRSKFLVERKRRQELQQNNNKLSEPKASNAGLCAATAMVSETPHSTTIQANVTACNHTMRRINSSGDKHRSLLNPVCGSPIWANCDVGSENSALIILAGRAGRLIACTGSNRTTSSTFIAEHRAGNAAGYWDGGSPRAQAGTSACEFAPAFR